MFIPFEVLKKILQRKSNFHYR